MCFWAFLYHEPSVKAFPLGSWRSVRANTLLWKAHRAFKVRFVNAEGEYWRAIMAWLSVSLSCAKMLLFAFRRNIFLLWPDLLSIFEISVSNLFFPSDCLLETWEITVDFRIYVWFYMWLITDCFKIFPCNIHAEFLNTVFFTASIHNLRAFEKQLLLLHPPLIFSVFLLSFQCLCSVLITRFGWFNVLCLMWLQRCFLFFCFSQSACYSYDRAVWDYG